MATIKSTIQQSISSLPHVSDPIPVTDKSHPFNANAFARVPLPLADLHYIEEEYFLDGQANVYTQADDQPAYVKTLPYQNRILVRRPDDQKAFSGRVFIDIYNASNGYDIEDMWRRSARYFIDSGDIYIGLTSKPINVVSLKHFDYARYQSLNWGNGEVVPQPAVASPGMSIPGTEEGLIWDMISQLGALVKSNQAPFIKSPVAHVFLMGQSQSGVYLNSYVYFFDQYAQLADGQPLFDGYFSTVSAGLMRSLRQGDSQAPFEMVLQRLNPPTVPYISMSSQGDINLFSGFKPSSAIDDLAAKAAHDPAIKVRHYQLASSPHTDPASPLVAKNTEIVKTQNPPRLLDGDYDFIVNDIQLAYYMNAGLEFLYQWAANGSVPPASTVVERAANGKAAEDQYGNGLGGLRSPYVDVPVAQYFANAPVINPNDRASGDVNGSMRFFSKDKLISLYGNKAAYLKQFADAVAAQEASGWLLKPDAQAMVAWSERIADQIFN